MKKDEFHSIKEDSILSKDNDSQTLDEKYSIRNSWETKYGILSFMESLN